MDFRAKLAGEALNLSRQYRGVLGRLPRTFLVSNLIELQKWAALFEPERAYFRELLKLFSELTAPEFQEIFGHLVDLEKRTGCNELREDSPEEFQTHALDRLQRQGQYSAWRAEIARIFQAIEPRVESRLHPSQGDPRLVLILYSEGIAITRGKLWQRFRNMGLAIPLDLRGAETSELFLRTLFTGHAEPGSQGAPSTLFRLRRDLQNASPLDHWLIEAGEGLHTLCEKNEGSHGPYATGLSYDRLRAYRDRLTHSIYSKVSSGVRGPLELAAYLKTLEVRPQEGVSLFFDEVVLSFIRDVFLAGAGTLIINNTFVEWGAVQALKRAQPRFLVARFGVRDKLKPFSSLLLFSKPRPTDQIPILQDPFGSFVDVELLSYYIWLKAEEGPPYRDNTLYLLLAEGVDEMLAIRPASRRRSSGPVAAASLADVAATIAHWLGVELPGSPGRPIAPLVS